MKRRSLLQRAVQLLGGAAAALVVKDAPAFPAPAKPFPKRGPARVGPSEWEKLYDRERQAAHESIQWSGQEDDLFSVFEQIGREMGKAAAHTRDLEVMSVFGVKPR